jgi:hypothetical protein
MICFFGRWQSSHEHRAGSGEVVSGDDENLGYTEGCSLE